MRLFQRIFSQKTAQTPAAAAAAITAQQWIQIFLGVRILYGRITVMEAAAAIAAVVVAAVAVAAHHNHHQSQ